LDTSYSYGKTGDDINDQTNELPREEGNITSKVDKKSKNEDKGFTIGHLNIRSLIKNIDQLKIYLSNHQYDIICINETWLDDKINTYEVSLDGYDLVRKDRKRTGGAWSSYVC
jgi:hypothetical protein